MEKFQRVCFCLQVKCDQLDEYVERHKQVWPEMLDALRAAGWRNYSLFLRNDGLLIGYLETDDFNRAVREMRETEINLKWQAEMVPFFEGQDARHADGQMKPLPEVFHLD
jgi:L-rhamnose mutarotase